MHTGKWSFLRKYSNSSIKGQILILIFEKEHYVALAFNYVSQNVKCQRSSGRSNYQFVTWHITRQKNIEAERQFPPSISRLHKTEIHLCQKASWRFCFRDALQCRFILYFIMLMWVFSLCRCYNYWFWVPVVAPPLGGVLGSFFYLLFIDWQLPDPEAPEDHPTQFSVSEKVKGTDVTWGKKEELKTTHF